VRVRNTLALDRLLVSPAFRPDLSGRDDLRVVVPSAEWSFTQSGDLDPAEDLLLAAAPA